MMNASAIVRRRWLNYIMEWCLHGTFCDVRLNRMELHEMISEDVDDTLEHVPERGIVMQMLEEEKTKHEIDQYVLGVL